MAEMKYLYGAAVQGIQSFIFQTNELKDIVGASELVEEICQDAFKEFSDGKGEPVVNAAGNIKFIFDKREDCAAAVLKFPKKVMEMAPGITISQAVVEDPDKDFKKAVDKLEEHLRIQRNKPVRSMTLGLTGMLRSRKTGAPAVEIDAEDYLDSATQKKKKMAGPAHLKLCKKCFGIENLQNRIARQIDEIATKNDWIAVIHADGNGLGKIIQEIGSDEKLLHKFSSDLDEATAEAAQEAFCNISDKYKFADLGFIPIRPIVLGGDDFTVICRADFALEYVETYIRSFENKTEEELHHKLTACAGIAFIKSSYPFYYGYNLAESLCDGAKKDAKKEEHRRDGLAPSCLMFHKVQDSFVEDYSDIVKRELIPHDGHSFKFGPYYINENIEDRWTVDDLIKKIKLLDNKEGSAVKSHLRQWMSLMHDNPSAADQKVSRIITMQPSWKAFIEEVTKGHTEKQTGGKDKELHVYPVYDMLAIHSVIYQVTKEDKTKEDKK